MVSPLEVLERARRLIANPDDWCKGTLRSGDGSYCLLGALEEATFQLSDNVPSLEELPLPPQFLTWEQARDFNDASSTTHEQILSALDQAINAAREGAGVLKDDAQCTA